MSTPTRHRGRPAPAPAPTVQHRDQQDSPRFTGPAPSARSRPAASVDLDRHTLVIGYLSTVAGLLDQRGFLIRALHGQEPRSAALWGSLTFDPAHTARSGWAPARLRWQEDDGWIATLLPASGDERLAVSRFLPGQLVPAPTTVAQFVTALCSDPNTVQACATVPTRRRVDPRWLVLQLARFTMPEPR
jgi:hypothetical protein